jgi:hypothetical protein
MALLLGILLTSVGCATAAASNTVFLADTLGVSGSSAVKAKTSSDYDGYADAEVACLHQLNFKSCRYTACLEPDFCLANVVAQ